jgi:hypothetical protein
MTNNFNIMIPLQLTSNILSVYLAFISKGVTISIYRFGGSVINQTLLGSLSYVFLTQTIVTPWNLQSNWVISLAYSYLQNVNLEQTNVANNLTTISMSGSIMPIHNNPFLTVSISYLEILMPSTVIIVGNTILNRTCNMFTYFYNQQMLQTFVCMLYGNSNSTINNIQINYPIFSNNLGPGYPFN